MSDDEDYNVMEDEDYGGEEEPSFSCSPPRKILKNSSPCVASSSSVSMDELDRMMADSVSALQEVLGDLTSDESIALLTTFGWNPTLVEQAWFDSGSDRVCAKSGFALGKFKLTSYTAVDHARCSICLEEKDRWLQHESCMHSFCVDCYKQYLAILVSDGQDSVRAHCPSFRCASLIPSSTYSALLDEERRLKLLEWTRKNFISQNPSSLRWCPNPLSCSFLVRASPCECGYVFCWTCLKESHLPVTCPIADQWFLKNSSESENVSWIVAHTKPCPKCHKPIEKNQGCNHMTCSRKGGGCGAEFCWMCLEPWTSHSTSTGGFYTCNLFPAVSSVTVSSDEALRATTKHALDRYMFYFGRYMNHQKGALLARRELDSEIGRSITKLHQRYGLSVSEVEFLQGVLEQVVECRQVLKWTYVFAYYREKDELLEYLQTNLEEFTDRLHEYVERDLIQFLEEPTEDAEEGHTADASPPESVEETKTKFLEFRSIVSNQMFVTRNFFSRIVSDLSVGR